LGAKNRCARSEQFQKFLATEAGLVQDRGNDAARKVAAVMRHGRVSFDGSDMELVVTAADA